MTESELKRALELFGRVRGVDDPNEGVGVGLPLAREIAKAHGGRLDVKSEPGEGVTASAIFPAARIIARAEPLAAPAPASLASLAAE